MHFAKLLTVIFGLRALIAEGGVHRPRLYHQIGVRSHGCGQNPLLQILDESTVGTNITPEEVLEILDANESLRTEVLEMLRLYDDCIRTADGMRYRRTTPSDLSEAHAAFYAKVAKVLQEE